MNRPMYTPHNRRGILLMVVLSLLAIFAMIAITFVIVANQSAQESKISARHDTVGDEPQDVAERALYQLLRDVPVVLDSNKNVLPPRSAVAYHSLLRDLYGVDGFTATVNANNATANGAFFAGATSGAPLGTTGGQFVDLLFDPASAYLLEGQSSVSASLSPTTNYYNGCVLTFTGGRARGQSARVVGYTPADQTAGTPARLRIMRVELANGAPLTAATVGDLADTKFVLNGRPFNGTGAGFNPAAGLGYPKLNATDDTGILQVALTPNAAGFQPRTNATPNMAPYVTFNGLGGLDESYDAPDYQNMFLAYIPVDAGETAALVDTAPRLIPSFHRPALINYWYRWMFANLPWSGNESDEDKWRAILQPYGADSELDSVSGNSDDWPDTRVRDMIVIIKRKINLRPLREINPHFTGGNPAADSNLKKLIDDGTLTAAQLSQSFFERVGPWDVDNDGDGVRESVWLDLGFPVQRRADGRLYKPMVAFLCEDLDGRLNLNAHGSPFDVKMAQKRTDMIAQPLAVADARYEVRTQDLAGGANSFLLPRGEGYGTPEISLQYLLSPANYFNLAERRYGPLPSTGPDPVNQPGQYKDRVDPLAAVRFSDCPDRSKTADPRTAYSSQSNLQGRYGVGLDARGNPVQEMNLDRADLRADTPYELDLSRGAPRGGLVAIDPGVDAVWGTDDDILPKDTPFTIYELEDLLRPFDADSAAISDRLSNLLKGSLGSNPRLARLLTTDSWSLPVPAVGSARELRETQFNNIPNAQDRREPRSILEIIEARAREKMGWPTFPQPLDPTQTNELNAILYGNPSSNYGGLLSHDLLMGMRMDVNRPFGNGLDDNGNGVVDEPGEGNLANYRFERLWPAAAAVAGAAFTPLDVDKNGVVNDADYLLQRQLYARHLYVLMMALTDDGYQLPEDPNNPGLTAAELRKLKARRIAQWAINVVDFRDADAIMTPFEYDEEPFNGWDVDGWLGTTPGANGQFGDRDDQPSPDDDDPVNAPERGLVWGCERPELVITETLAWHDRRTEDRDDAGPDDKTTSDGEDAPGDTVNDFDQRFPPQSAFFMELYNANPASGVYPTEFYLNQRGVVLNRKVGDSPVWRVLVVKGDTSASPPGPKDLDPDDPDPSKRPFTISPPKNYIERSIYLTDISGGASGFSTPEDAGAVRYYTKLGVGQVEPGNYAVIGPSGSDNGISYIGHLKPSGPNAVITTPGDPPSQTPDTTRHIALTPGPAAPGNVQVTMNSEAATRGPVVPVAGVVIDRAYSPATGDGQRSLSISDPKNGYPATTGIGPKVGQYDPPRDQPLDDNANPADDRDAVQTLGTHEHFRMVHLQRLANPLLPWDEDTNPYLTVDSMSVNLTVFNGIDANEKTGNDGKGFGAKERGQLPSDGQVGAANLWTHEGKGKDSEDSDQINVAPLGDHVFNFQLRHSLGFLNSPYHPDFVAGDSVGSTANTSDPSGQEIPPKTPFPWLTWNNRPFISQYELTLVPASSSSRLFYDFSLASTTANPYDASGNNFDNYRSPFKHLLNFFQTAKTPGAATDTAAHFYRLFDYTYVPSRFVGNETLLNPSAFTNAAPETEGFRPPFDRVSDYREPGRVNLNTIPPRNGLATDANNPVWKGILNGHQGPTWDQLVDSRRGYGAVNRPSLFFEDDSPTFFANPFRAAGAGELVPLGAMMRPDVEATLMRSGVQGNLAARKTPDKMPLVDGRNNKALYNDAGRNPYFRYQPMTRLGNLTTTQSNVFAVWVTVGYFEVEPAPSYSKFQPSGVTMQEYRVRYPDGYRLGREIGWETGEIQRRRAFFIIDRSIPVAFQPGENHNVDKAILLRRFLE